MCEICVQICPARTLRIPRAHFYLEAYAGPLGNVRSCMERFSSLTKAEALRGDDLLHCDHLPSLHGGGGDQLHREYCLRHLLSIGRKTIISKTNQTKQLFQKQIMTTGAKAVYNNSDRAKHLKCVPGDDQLIISILVLDNELKTSLRLIILNEKKRFPDLFLITSR